MKKSRCVLWAGEFGITYFECVFVALVIQHARRIHPIILSSVTLKCSSTLFRKRHDVRNTPPPPKRNIKQKMCVLIISTNFSETFLVLKINERDITINVQSLCEVPLILVIL